MERKGTSIKFISPSTAFFLQMLSVTPATVLTTYFITFCRLPSYLSGLLKAYEQAILLSLYSQLLILLSWIKVFGLAFC